MQKSCAPAPKDQHTALFNIYLVILLKQASQQQV